MLTRGKRSGTIRHPYVIKLVCLQKLREFRCEHVSVSEVGDGFQVLFEKTPGSEKGYVLVQRHFEFPDGGKCYLETDDPEFCGHFLVHSCPGIGSKWCSALGLLERSRCFSRQRIQLIPRFSVCSRL